MGSLFVFAVPASAEGLDNTGAGLYRDGVKVLDLQEAGTAEQKLLTGKDGEPQKSLGRAFRDEITGEQSSSPFSERRAFYGLAIQCRDRVAGFSSANGNYSYSEEDITQLLSLSERLQQVNQAVLTRYDEIGLDCREHGYPAEKLDRLGRAVEGYRILAESILGLLDNLKAAYTSGDAAGIEVATKALAKFFNDHPLEQEQPSLGGQPLPVQMQYHKAPVYEAEGLPKTGPVNRPAGSLRSPDPADLAETIDVQFTNAITDLALTLNHSPVKIYNFVRDNFDFEAYLGSRKGSQQTLDHRSGNDYDQASLLLALLRVSGIPARYATGTVQMPIDRATNWLGIEDPYNASSLLTTAGMEGVLYTMGGQPYAIRCKRVWVEAWVPFVNYRGATNDGAGFRWVPLDPTFKQYEYGRGIDLPEEIGFDAQSFVREYYLSGTKPETPTEAFKQMLVDELAVHYPAAAYEDLITTRSVIKETDGILPGTLPYELITPGSSFSEIPAAKRYYITFHLYDDLGMNLSYTASVPEIAEKQVTISYIGATAADQTMIDNAGGIFNVANPSLVDLKPVLKIDGCVVATASGSIVMGRTHYSDMHFNAPAGASNQMPLVQNVITAGNYQGIGIDTEDAYPAVFGSVETTCDENELGKEQHQLALTYLNECNKADDEISSLLHIVMMNDIAEAIVENSVTVFLDGWGNPSTMDWTGMTVDADRKIVGPFSVHGSDNACDVMRLGGAAGSIEENRLFEVRFEEEAISAVKILAIAADSGIAICELIPGSPIATQCPGWNHTTAIWDEVTAALAAGRHVIIPERDFTYFEWSGTGYIDIEPTTCAAGYIIAGGHNGGATVQEWRDPWYLFLGLLSCKISVPPITCEPVATNDLYCSDSQAYWTFVVKKEEYLAKWPTCLYITHVDDKQYVVTRSIKSIADDVLLGPGVYEFRTAYFPGNSCGCNTTPLTKTVTIAKSDPVIRCPDNATTCSSGTAPAWTGAATATNDCGGSPSVTYSDLREGDVITRTWTATDGAGRSATCDQIITIVADTVPPIITCPADMTTCHTATAPARTGYPTASDECDGQSLLATFSDVRMLDVITRTWTATDAAGNSATCAQRITIVADTVAPIVICPADVTTCPSATAPARTGTATATDDCDGALQATFTDARVGDVITRTWTARDAAGNHTTCGQTITIVADTVDPIVTCPADVPACAGSTDPASTGTATATDACDGSLQATFTDAQVGDVITRTWTATDAAFNSASCEQTVSILHAEITPSADAIDGNNSGQFSVTVEPAGFSPSSYQWTWQSPQGAGNNPQADFASPNQQNTTVNNAHWFALPDNRLYSATGWDCNYTINCTVTVNGMQCVDLTPPTWRVYLPVPPATTSFPTIEGMVTIGVRQVSGADEWYVSAMGTLTRTTPQVTPNIPSTSQFYNKVVTVHEGRHVTQFASIAPWKDLFDAASLYNSVLSGMTSTVSEQDLRDLVQLEIDLRVNSDIHSAELTRIDAERDAFQQSNAVPPDYLEVDIP